MSDKAAGVRVLKAACAVLVASIVLIGNSVFADTPTPQVQIEAKMVEIDSARIRDLGLGPQIADLLGKLPPDASKLSSPQATVFGFGPAPSASVIGQRLFPTTGAPGDMQLSGLLTAPQYDAILKALGDEKTGAKLLSLPRVTAPNNQPATINITPAQGFTDGQLIMDITPSVGPDGYSIDLSISPQVPQILPASGTAVQQPKGKSTGTATTITTGLGEVPLISGGLFSETPKLKRNLIIFITARIINPAGDGEYSVTTEDNGYLDNEDNSEQPRKAKVEAIGTGETIGHVADFKLQNLTNGSLVFVIPPLILESRDGKNQDYVCPDQEKVSVPAGKTKTVPVDGVCINRDKLPVDKGVTGAFAINTGDSDGAQRSDRHIPAKQAGDLLRICKSIYEAVDQLQKDGSLKDFPYKDKKEQREILEQWGVWTNPEISEITKTPPATKDDMKKVVYKQIEEKGTPSRDTTKKIDKGIDTVFEKVELTTKKAKDLEETDSSAQPKSPEQT